MTTQESLFTERQTELLIAWRDTNRERNKLRDDLVKRGYEFRKRQSILQKTVPPFPYKLVRGAQ